MQDCSYTYRTGLHIHVSVCLSVCLLKKIHTHHYSTDVTRFKFADGQVNCSQQAALQALSEQSIEVNRTAQQLQVGRKHHVSMTTNECTHTHTHTHTHARTYAHQTWVKAPSLVLETQTPSFFNPLQKFCLSIKSSS